MAYMCLYKGRFVGRNAAFAIDRRFAQTARQLPVTLGRVVMESPHFMVRSAYYEARLLDTYRSPILGAAVVRTLLGFPSQRAFGAAARCGYLPVKTFFLPGRRGRFARLTDMAAWLASIDAAATCSTEAP